MTSNNEGRPAWAGNGLPMRQHEQKANDDEVRQRVTMTENGETVYYVKERPPMSGGAITAVVTGLLSPLILGVLYFVTKFTLFPSTQGNQLFVYAALGVAVLGLLAGLSAKRLIKSGKERGREMADAGAALNVLAIGICVFILWPIWTAAQVDNPAPADVRIGGQVSIEELGGGDADEAPDNHVESPVDETGDRGMLSDLVKSSDDELGDKATIEDLD